MATAKKKAAGKKAAAKKGGATKSSGGSRGAAGKSAAKKGGATKSSGASRGGAAKKAGGSKTAAKKSGGATKRAPNPAFMKAMRPSPQLAAVVGEQPMPRTEVTSKVWAYIKKNGLQDQKNRRAINADDKLRPIFGKNQVTMFEMTSLVNKHLGE
jgi:chromatin remodeling complex protein RSC6